MRRKNFRNLKLRRQFQLSQKLAPFAQRRFQKRAPIQPQQIEGDEDNRDISGNGRKQIRTLILSTQTFLQIEERKFLSVLEGHDLAIQNEFVGKLSRLFRDLNELIGHAPQIARENFHAVRSTMQVRTNAIEFVFNVNCR